MSLYRKITLIVFFISLITPKAFTQISLNTTSNLPLVVINTNGQTILDTPKITADMGIIWNGPGKRNSLNDPMNDYNGKIGIEIRGSSSQMFPKKSYGFETRSTDGLDLNVSLLGMPEENDWILYAPYTDKSMIRDVLSYTLYAALGSYSPRCHYVELVLDGSYEGVYVLMEKIKRDKGRVDIAKLTTADNTGENLTGGYIIKIDKTTGSGGEGWSSYYSNTVGNTYYQYDYPKQEDITDAQRTYLQTWVNGMEKALYTETFSGAGSYHEFLNDSSCIDFMILNELAKNVDGYRLSSYLYKDKNKLMKAGPIWDFNLTYGNANYYNGWIPTGFQYQADLGGDYWQNPFWWNKLMRDQSYVKSLKKRWATLRLKELSSQRINYVVDSLTSLISEAEVRNYVRWPILGTAVWPNYYVGPTYTSEIIWMKDWITKRLIFMDQMWPYNFSADETQLAQQTSKIFPNPFTDKLTVQLPTTLNGMGYAEFFSTDGSLLRTNSVDIQNGQIQLEFNDRNALGCGLYMLRISLNGRVVGLERIVRSH